MYTKIFIVFAFTLVYSVLQASTVSISSSDGKIQLPQNSKGISNEGQSRQEEEESETHKPPLYPALASIIGAALGANDSQVNRTIDRIYLSHNGIDPDAPSTTTTEAAEEEEDEDEDSDNPGQASP